MPDTPDHEELLATLVEEYLEARRRARPRRWRNMLRSIRSARRSCSNC